MREVDEAAGEAVADSVAAHTEAYKPAQDYIPVIVDDDVRQKGRAKQKQMLISRGAFPTLAHDLCALSSLARFLARSSEERGGHRRSRRNRTRL